MKYKRQLITTMFALSLLTGGSYAFAAEDSVPTSKVSQYESQMHMKSFDKINTETNSKKITKRNKRLHKVNNQR